jgi:RNA polymerase sigma factor (sigma-70 family)
MNTDLQTRASLLSRMRQGRDHDGWQVFFDTYWKLIYGTSIKAGLSDTEAEEAVQETVITVSKKLETYDPGRGSFKHWLLAIARFRILDQFRRRKPVQQAWPVSPDEKDRKTATLDRLPDPKSLELEAIWEQEWRRNLLHVAIERIKGRVNEKHYQIFYLTRIKEISTTEVARALRVNLAQVYLARSRVGRLVKKEVQRLEAKEMKGIQ